MGCKVNGFRLGILLLPGVFFKMVTFLLLIDYQLFICPVFIAEASVK
jgi:hypothetical protein